MPHNTDHQKQKMDRYYRFHSLIYDATRWSILFGRNSVVQQSNIKNNKSFHILEVGAGTGGNIQKIKKQYPEVSITALDISDFMLSKAKAKLANEKNMRYLSAKFNASLFPENEKFDLIIFSYCLSMFSENWDTAIDDAKSLLKNDGEILVVDFHNSHLAPMKKIWSSVHVNLGGHLIADLDKKFSSRLRMIYPAYFGLWQYFIFTGSPKN